MSAVPSQNYKVKTEWLKDGCLCVNVSADKNFEKDVREKVGTACFDLSGPMMLIRAYHDQASMYLPAVGKVTILMLLRNLFVHSPPHTPVGSVDILIDCTAFAYSSTKKYHHPTWQPRNSIPASLSRNSTCVYAIFCTAERINYVCINNTPAPREGP